MSAQKNSELTKAASAHMRRVFRVSRPMTMPIGLQAEVSDCMDGRTPITPTTVEKLVRGHGIQVQVQRSAKRVFPEQHYRSCGAKIVDDLSDCPVVFGLKQMPIDTVRSGSTLVFFSHTHKGQPHNMPLLGQLMARGVTLIDYERITDSKGRRLIGFGYLAGCVGMTDTLHALGQRLKLEGLHSALGAVLRVREYGDLGTILNGLRKVGDRIRNEGMPPGAGPLVIALTGRGRAAAGAADVLAALSPKLLSPAELLEAGREGLSLHEVYAVRFERLGPRGRYERTDGQVATSQAFEADPTVFSSTLPRYLPYITLLVNAVYWESPQPPLLTRADLLAVAGEGRLRAIGDITCDPWCPETDEGPLESTQRCSGAESPYYTYDPRTGETCGGLLGEGIAVNAQECMPAELAAEASSAFSSALLPYVPDIAAAAYDQDFHRGSRFLPAAIRRGILLWNGHLTPDYDALPALRNSLARLSLLPFPLASGSENSHPQLGTLR